ALISLFRPPGLDLCPTNGKCTPRDRTARGGHALTQAKRGKHWLGIIQLTGQPAKREETQAMDKRDHKQRYDAGLKTRREVLGAEYVDKAIAAQDEFNRPLQELLNTYCWNDVWNRPGLPRKTRSMLNLAMLSALNKPHELKLHLNGALNNGLTKQD